MKEISNIEELRNAVAHLSADDLREFAINCFLTLNGESVDGDGGSWYINPSKEWGPGIADDLCCDLKQLGLVVKQT